MSHGGGEGALAVLATTTETKPQHVMRVRMVSLPAALLDCHTCHLPLKPPIFKCDANHPMCSSCREVHGEACDLMVVRCTILDTFAAAAMVRCDFEKYGCDAGYIVYHEAADHRRMCQHAPALRMAG